MTRQFFLRTAILLSCWAGWGSGFAESERDRVFWEGRFQGNQVLEIEISLSPEAWAEMEPRRRSAGRGAGPARQLRYPYVRADLRVGDQLLKDVGLRYKGNSSYNASSRKLRRPLKIDTNRFVKGLRLFGRTKLNLATGFLDSTFMKEKLAYEVYEAAGLMTPGVGWAEVKLSINGVIENQALGVYVMIEQIDRGFLDRRIGGQASRSVLMKPEGVGDWPYLGDEPSAYERYNIKSGEANRIELKLFAETLRLIEQAGDEEFERWIGTRIDLNTFAGYLAATALLVNFDSYIGSPHNYYLLLDARTQKLQILPWDLNESFGGFLYLRDPRARSAEQLVEWSIAKPWVTKRTLIKRLFKLNSFRERYQMSLQQLIQKVFSVDSISQRTRTFEQVLRPYVRRDQNGLGIVGMRMGIEGDRTGINQSIERRLFAILPFVRHRLAFVSAQLMGRRQGYEYFQ